MITGANVAVAAAGTTLFLNGVDILAEVSSLREMVGLCLATHAPSTSAPTTGRLPFVMDKPSSFVRRSVGTA